MKSINSSVLQWEKYHKMRKKHSDELLLFLSSR